MKDDVVRFSVSLPAVLMQTLDQKVEEKSSTRSEFIRDLIRQKIVDDKWNGDEDGLIGVLSAVYDHHQNDLVSKKMTLEHGANIDIICTTHIHIDHTNCLEISVLKGNNNLIKAFYDKISGLKGIKFAELSKIAIPNK
ncbi:MAG: nickel-responsive transcriptional regulator NikR [Campylobacter sp.]|nr:nickel-responsive transcriptional regulator NikR [Campylobacter sp.]